MPPKASVIEAAPIAVEPPSTTTPYIVNSGLKDAVQKMLDRVEERKPNQAQAEDMVNRTIQTLVSLKRHLKEAYDEGGDAALETLFQHRKVYIPVSKVKTWLG